MARGLYVSVFELPRFDLEVSLQAGSRNPALQR
jgi:hypothetical protein